MGFMSDEERTFSRAVSELALANPFLPERIVAEKKALGDAFIETGPVWHARPVPLDTNRNVQRIAERVGALVGTLRERLAAGADPGADATLYEEVATYHLYARVEALLYELTVDAGPAARVEWFPRFAREVRQHFELPALAPAAPPDPAQLIAFFFQVRRAFHFTMQNILGGSLPAARLRAAVWQAIFTHDMRRYRRGLWQRMHDVPTLIVGPTGSGKELVARAIGLSRHIPFQSAGQRFGEDFREGVFALNLSALSSTLIESELFGHRRGAFTGAVADRPGWLEVCPPLGTVFLDEIAEVDASIQVKLLRVLQTRTFQRVGDTQERRFQGKIVAATNRDLAAEMAAGRFRPDLYYRLCADVIETPSLAAILRDAPGELPALLRFLAARIAGGARHPAGRAGRRVPGRFTDRGRARAGLLHAGLCSDRKLPRDRAPAGARSPHRHGQGGPGAPGAVAGRDGFREGKAQTDRRLGRTIGLPRSLDHRQPLAVHDEADRGQSPEIMGRCSGAGPRADFLRTFDDLGARIGV